MGACGVAEGRAAGYLGTGLFGVCMDGKLEMGNG